MGYDETANLKLKKLTIGTVKTEWPGYINGNFDTIDGEMANRHKVNADVVPDTDNVRSIGSAIRRFLSAFVNTGIFGQITLGGVTRSAWPSPGSGSQSMDDAYNNGSVVNVDNTDIVHQLGAGKKFRLVNTDGSVTYMEAEGGKGVTVPDTRQNLIANSQFSIWSNATMENVGGNLIPNGTFDTDVTGWTPTNGTIASVAGGQSGNCLEITMVSAVAQFADSTAIPTVAGKLYRVNAYVKSGTGGTAYIIQPLTSTRTPIPSQVTGNTTGSWVQTSFVFKAADATSYVRVIKFTSTAGTMLFDEVTVTEAVPGCIAADAKAMDGWAKTSGTLLYRQINDGAYAKGGSLYSLKVIGGASGNQTWWPGPLSIYRDAAWVAQFRGRTVTFGCWVLCSSPSKARISIYDNTEAYSAYHSGSGAWEWLEVTRTISPSASYFYITLYSGTSTTAYFSQPQLVFGLSIGAGNYAPRPGEIVWLETPVVSSALNNKSGLSTQSAATLDVEGDSLGLIGRGAKALYWSLMAMDSASATSDCYVVLCAVSPKYAVIASPGGLANGRYARTQGWMPLAEDGTYQYLLAATGAGTLSVPWAKIVGVQF